MALTASKYAVPAVAADRLVVLITSGGGGGGVMVTYADADLVGSAALVTVMVAVESVLTVDA